MKPLAVRLFKEILAEMIDPLFDLADHLHYKLIFSSVMGMTIWFVSIIVGHLDNLHALPQQAFSEALRQAAYVHPTLLAILGIGFAVAGPATVLAVLKGGAATSAENISRALLRFVMFWAYYAFILLVWIVLIANAIAIQSPAVGLLVQITGVVYVLVTEGFRLLVLYRGKEGAIQVLRQARTFSIIRRDTGTTITDEMMGDLLAGTDHTPPTPPPSPASTGVPNAGAPTAEGPGPRG